MSVQYEKKREIAGSLCKAIGMQYMMASTAFRDDPGECTTLGISVAMVGIAATCMNITTSSPKRPPTPDEILFTCLFISNSVAFDRDDTLGVEFGIDNVIRTLEQFKEMTGRELKTMNPSLLQVVEEVRAQSSSKSFPEGLSKFLPN
jgi:hypothetical protein